MLKVIKSEAEYDAALARIYELMQMDLVDDSSESDELDALALFVVDYENKHSPLPPTKQPF